MGMLIYVVLIVSISVGIIGFLGFNSDDKILLNNFEKQAEFLTSKNEYEKAIFYYDKILLDEPKSLKILLDKSNALMSLNEFEKAIKVFDIVLEFDPVNDFAKKGNELATQKFTESLKSSSAQKNREIVVPHLLPIPIESEPSLKINEESFEMLDESSIYQSSQPKIKSLITSEII